ncbi:MAG: HxsD-like protein [Myxococcota bacterium]
MRALKLHHDLYSSMAVEEACNAFAGHASIESRQEKPYFELSISATDGADEDELVGELANYILALTVEEKRGAREE